VLHLYVDHKIDVADLIDPTEQLADVKKGVGEEEVVEDANVEIGAGDEEGVEDVGVDKGVGEEEGVGEDSFDDPDYEASGDENLSGYDHMRQLMLRMKIFIQPLREVKIMRIFRENLIGLGLVQPLMHVTWMSSHLILLIVSEIWIVYP